MKKIYIYRKTINYFLTIQDRSLEDYTIGKLIGNGIGFVLLASLETILFHHTLHSSFYPQG